MFLFLYLFCSQIQAGQSERANLFPEYRFLFFILSKK